MRALTWHGGRDVRVDTVPDPTIIDPEDVIVEITSTGLCGSDLHLYEVMGPFLSEGDVPNVAIAPEPRVLTAAREWPCAARRGGSR